MIVYRLEHGAHKDSRTGCGGGPYSYMWQRGTPLEYDPEFGAAQEKLFDDSDGDTHMGPFRDPTLGGIMPWEICGLDSLQSFIAWFGEERTEEWVDRFGFVVAKYDVPDDRCRVGLNGQVLFEYKKAVRVQEESNDERAELGRA